jgi:hypothetical protein
MSLRKILLPEKGKILPDVLFSVFWLAAVFNVEALGFRNVFSGFDPQAKILVAALNFFVFLVLFYPLSCGAVYIIRRFARKEPSNGKDLMLAVLLIAVFNPIFFSLMAMGISKIDTQVLNRPCGLEITGFPEYSTAADSGISVGNTITSIEGRTVDTADALLNSLKDKKEGDAVSVGTDGGEYKIKVALHPEKKSPVLGVNVKQRYCSR